MPSYREADVSDIDAIVELWDKSRVYHEDLDVRLSMNQNASKKARDSVRELLASENTVFYLAIVDGVTIGYICAMSQKRPSIYEKPFIGLIDGLYVAKDFRNRGIGSHLVDLARRWFKKQDIDTIQLTVASKNSIGMQFWEKCGFQELQRRMHQQI